MDGPWSHQMQCNPPLGDLVHLYPAVADRLLPPTGRDHPPDITGRPSPGKISSLHHDLGHAVNLRHCRGAQHTLQVRMLSDMSRDIEKSIFVNSRSPATHRMSPWVKKVFIDVMPKMLFMTRPHYAPRCEMRGKH